jgi:hypothetical protein
MLPDLWPKWVTEAAVAWGECCAALTGVLAIIVIGSRLTDLTCGHARNAEGAAWSIAAKASGPINVLNNHREPRRHLLITRRDDSTAQFAPRLLQEWPPEKRPQASLH